MQRSWKVVRLILLCALLVAVVAPAALAQTFTPQIYAVSQDVIDNTVHVTRVTSDGPGWVVVRADNDGEPTDVLGYVAVPNGISSGVSVQAEVPAGTKLLWISLNQDLGAEGAFEFPGDDEVAAVDGAQVMVSINVNEIGTSLLGAVMANPDLSTLAEAVELAGLAGELRDGGPYTVFAPTNEAFDALPAGTLDSLRADPETLGGIVLYHVAPGAYASNAITESVALPSAQGEDLDVQVNDGAITVNGANVVEADVEVFNGVIHVIDSVLMPPSIAEAQAAAEAAANTPVTETAAVTESAAVTETAAVTESAAVTEAVAVTETAVVTESAVVTETAAVTETPEVAATEATTQTEVMTESAVITESVAPAEAPAGAEAPATLPTTGAAPQNGLSLLVTVGVLALLVAGAYVTRRRTA